MSSFSIWDHSWVPLQLQKFSSYLQRHATIPIPPLSGLPLQVVETCEAGIHDWRVYNNELTSERDKDYAGASERSPSLASPARFRQVPAQRMFEAAFLGLLRTRMALMWTQHSSEDAAFPHSIEMPILPKEPPVDHKRTVGYWVTQSRLAFLGYSPETSGGRSMATILQEPSESTSQVSIFTGNAGQLLTAAQSFEKLSGQCRLGANILYAAWALRRILESPSDFLVSPSGDSISIFSH